MPVSACGSSSSRDQCADPNGTDPNANLPTGSSGAIGGQPAGENPRADECQKMDIVFVVDDLPLDG